MHVAITIVGYRNAGDITRCLKALEQSTHQDFEVTICENGGPEACANLIRAIAELDEKMKCRIRVINAPANGGYASGVNICLKATPHADAWWVLNPDTEPFPDVMERLAQRLQKKDCDAVGGTLLFSNGQVQSHGGVWHSWLGRAVSIGYGSSALDLPDQKVIETTQNYLSGASMMISRRFLAASGPLREDYFLYCEEIDWFLRGAKKSMKLGFAPGAFVLHHQGTTTGKTKAAAARSGSSVYLDERNKVLLTRDHFPLQTPIAIVAAFLITSYRYARRGAWVQFKFASRGWLAGIRNERGVPRWLQA